MKLKGIFIKELFGLYTYRLNFDNEEGLTILTGPNGYGKTTILNSINYLCTQNFYYFSTLEFKQIAFEFEKGYKIIITRDKKGSNELDAQSLEENDIIKFDLLLNNISEAVLSFKTREFLKKIESLGYSKVREGLWTDKYDNYYFSLTEILEQEREFPEISSCDSTNEKLSLFLSSLNTCCFIKEKRLSTTSSMNMSRKCYPNGRRYAEMSAIQRLSGELRDEMRDTGLKTMKSAQKIESSFPKRILSNTTNFLDNDTYKKRLTSLKNKLLQLKRYGLSDMAISDIEDLEYNDANKQILSTYLYDTEQKASNFDELLSKLNLFEEIINKKEFASKKIYINPEEGFGFKSNNGKELKLDLLSSGEQHELIMIYYLLFHTQPETLVLIDEPEISLHVAWQQVFIDDLLAIAEVKDLNLIVATHSPQIIGSKWDSCKDLYEISNKMMEG